jgi:hypothetical protein
MSLVAVAACHPSASVQNTMPLANLKTYHTVAVRVRAAATNWQREANALQQMMNVQLQSQCGFEQVLPANAQGVDLMIDLNVVGAGRGGTGMLRNPNLATIETLLVLSDGASGELLGTARVHGESSGMAIQGASPEGEAVQIVAKTVAEQLAKSGCAGPRLAKVEQPPPDTGNPPPTGSGTEPTGSNAGTPPPDESHRADAEALNDKGKDALRSADIPGAISSFQQANQLLPDARYEYNVCLAMEAGQQWDGAMSACQQARGMNAKAELVTKIDARIELLKNKQ